MGQLKNDWTLTAGKFKSSYCRFLHLEGYGLLSHASRLSQAVMGIWNKRLDMLSVSTYANNMNKFGKFINDLITPTVSKRQESTTRKAKLTPVNEAILTYVAVQTMSGEDTTFFDKATFVAAPYVIDAVAGLGAQRGYEESKK